MLNHAWVHNVSMSQRSNITWLWRSAPTLVETLYDNQLQDKL